MRDRELHVRARATAVRCASCHAPLEPGDARGCERCGTVQHAECEAALGLCPTLGCEPGVVAAAVNTLPRPGGRRWRALRILAAAAFVVMWAWLLFGGLGRPSPSWAVVRQVGAFKDGEADVDELPALLETLRRTWRGHHQRAVRVVVDRCGLRAVPMLRARWPAEREHGSAAWILDYAVEVGAVDFLAEAVDALRSSRNPAVRDAAYEALAVLGPRAERLPDTHDLVWRGASAGDERERYHAQLALDALFDADATR